MLTGEAPFPTHQPALLASHHLASPPPLVADAGVVVPGDLQDLITALLAKRPEERPSTAAEVYAALALHLPKPDPGQAVRRTLPEDPRRPFLVPQGPILV